MPPKTAKTPAKAQIVRPPISTSSLIVVPEDAIDGFQDRVRTGIEWNIVEQAVQEHKRQCLKEKIPTLSFKVALKHKLQKSLFNLFINKKSRLSLPEHWEFSLPIAYWDNERFSNDEGHICFDSRNFITDNMKQILKKAVDFDDRNLITQELKKAAILRLTGCEMTQLDPTLKKFYRLHTLNLCGNFISEVDPVFLPPALQVLELQSNKISSIKSFAGKLPQYLVYLGLAKNFLTSECHPQLCKLMYISVLDLSDNDICELMPVLESLEKLPKLMSLILAGNPCSMCAAYAMTTLARLPRLLWLDEREILPKDRPEPTPEPYEPHPDDLRSAYFVFNVFRVMSAPQPPKPEKGVVTAFHVEVELPFLDSGRRQFLMFRRHESLIEFLPPNEDDYVPSIQPSLTDKSKVEMETVSSHPSDIYNRLLTVDPLKVIHYKLFESTRVQWNKVMTFQDPTIRIFCPDLRILRDTFRTEITARVMYYVTYPPVKPAKLDKKSVQTPVKPLNDQYCILATIKFKLQRADWTQNQQHFHWDNTMESQYALHWGDGDLSVLQYSPPPTKASKGKGDTADSATRRLPPDNLTCHFGIGIETLRPIVK